MKKTLIIIANFLIVLFTIFFVLLYVRKQSAYMEAYNTYSQLKSAAYQVFLGRLTIDDAILKYGKY